jgi:trigger factor
VLPQYKSKVPISREGRRTTVETISKRLDENKVEVTITLSSSEVDDQLAAVYKEAGKVRIPGFRPGKAPKRILENHYGGKEYFLATATEEAVRHYTPLAVDLEGFVLVDGLKYGEIGTVAEGQEFSYSLSFNTTPEATLSSYEPVQIEVPSITASQEEIASEINGLREYYASFEDISGRAAESGDVVDIVFIHDASEHDHDHDEHDHDEHDYDDDYDDDEQDDSEIDSAEAEDDSPHEHPQQLELGIGMMPESFEEHVIGLEIGQVSEFEFSFVEDQDNEEAKPVKVKLRLDAIKKKILPELTDEWVKETAEFDSLDALRERIKETIESEKQRNLGPVRETAASKALAERLQCEPPEALVKQTEQDNYKDFYNRLQSNRVSFDQYLAGNNLTPERFRTEMHDQAILSAKIGLALDALATHQGLLVSDEEIREEFDKSGAENPEKLFQEWKRQGRLSEVRQGISRMKASQFLLDNAEVFEPGTLVKAESEAQPVAQQDSQQDSQPEKQPATEAETPITADAANETENAEAAANTEPTEDKE